MTNAVSIAFFGWVAVVLVLFAVLPARRAAAVAFVLGWSILPVAVFPIAGLPDFSKMTATCAAPLVAVAIFDYRRLFSLRPIWADAPILLFCTSPFASSLQNGLGTHDAFSAVFAQILPFGIPYAIGRLYFGDLPGLRELATAIFAGGAAYVPLCAFELWRTPVLHKLVYGYGQYGLDGVTHFGILRPAVFMDAGLMLALWMAAATVVGIWFWRTGALPTVRGKWLGLLVLAMIVTVVLERSVNGWFALALGASLLLTAAKWRTAAPVIGVMVLILLHLTLRVSGLWSGEQLVSVASGTVNQERATSLLFRLLNEDVIAANTRPHWLMGIGRQGISLRIPPTAGQRVFGENAVPDSFWIIVFAQSGVVGLAAFTASVLFPVVVFLRRFPAGKWMDASIAPAAALAVILILYMTDQLVNSMPNPIFLLAAGGVSGLSRYPASHRAVTVAPA